MKMKNPFGPWAAWFEDWKPRQRQIPWQSHRPLTMAERTAITASIAEFQLGESSDGRQFHAAAIAHGHASGQPEFAEAVRDFIREENRHSEMLGRFMDMEGIARIQHSKADAIFRALRHSVPLSLSHRILVTAEFIAVPYYRALSKATCSTILNTICEQILEDEARHIAFQAQAIKMLQPKGKLRQSLHHTFSRLLLEVALDVVWWNHSDVLRRGGYTFSRLRMETLEQFDWAMGMVAGEIPIPDPKHLGTPPRSIQEGLQLIPLNS